MRRSQITCRCSAYPFPHRLTGGKCSGPEWAAAYFIWVGTACAGCNANNGGCEVAAGAESITECEGYEDALRRGAPMRLPVDENRMEEMLGRGRGGGCWMGIGAKV
jgi:hypothetical protein